MKIHQKHNNSSMVLRPPRHPEWSFAERLYTDQRFRLIQCKLCSSKFETTLALRQHLLLHADVSTLELQLDNEVVKELFPQAQQLDDVKASICEEIAQQRLAKYYAVVNEHGYEMSLSDSDAESETANEDTAAAKYKCELCAEIFTRKHKVFTHIKKQHATDQLPHKCAVCKVAFVSQPMFSLHTRTQCRSKEKKYQCLKCPGKFMWLNNLEEHKCSNRFNTPEYKSQLPRKRDAVQCNICQKTFSSTKEQKRHMESHNVDGRTHECTLCYERFRKAESLRQHVRSAHQQRARLHCCLCEQKCEKLSELRSHLQLHADGVTQVDMTAGQFFQVYYPQGCVGREMEVAHSIATDFQLENLARYYSAIDESGNELNVCDSEAEAERALVAESSTRNYKCDICEEVFSGCKRLLFHQHSKHAALETLPHVCTVCNRQFIALPLLQQHLSWECLNVYKKFQCEKCPCRFVWEENLQLHLELKHSDSEQQAGRQLAKKLQCDQCDKVFIWPKDLTRHKRVHMPDDEKYECPFCERKFNRKDNMHAHLKVHGVASAICKKDPSRVKATKLQVDENLCKPNGCKFIQCRICLSKHSKIADLRTHLRTHQYVVTFAQRQESIADISQLLYPEEPALQEQQLIERIIADVTTRQLDRFYSITNEVGYELNIDSSETESDSDAESAAEQLESNMRHNYSCDLCHVSYPRKYKLFEHQLYSHDWLEAPFVCPHCNARFLSDPLLQLHLEQQCKNLQKRFICRKCPRKFMWKDNFKLHMRTMHAELSDRKLEMQRSFECLQCNRSFQMQKDLTRHMVVHRTDVAVVKCLWCPRKFYRIENLHMHIRRHGVTSDCLGTAESIIRATSGPNGPKEIWCKVCNLSFPNIAALRTHLQQEASSLIMPHHNTNSLLNYSITNKLGFELQIDDSETEGNSSDDEIVLKPAGTPLQYTCKICNLTCRRKYALAQHQRSMHKHEQLPLKCDKCVFRTVSQDILTHHMRTQCHNTEKRFQCELCAFKFMWEDNLDTHKRQVHPQELRPTELLGSANSASAATTSARHVPSTEKVFPCDKCNRKYNRKDRLTAHMKKVHTKAAGVEQIANSENNEEQFKKPVMEKKFLCAFCGRAVTSSSNLIIHMRRHTGEKPFKCDLCDMAFPRSSDLQCHRRTHTGEKPHKCTVCDKAFSRSYKLHTHMRIHSGERPYKCTYCEKSFTQSNDLTLHIRRHTGERPYVCGICGESFIQGTALKNHRTMRGHFEDVQPRRTSMLEQF